MLRKQKTQAIEDPNKGSDQPGPARVNNQLILTCFGWSATPLKHFLQHCREFGRSFRSSHKA